MLNVKVVNPRKALVLARKWKPVFVQEYKSPLDLIAPIQLTGPYIVPEEPEIYFSVKEDKDFYYIFYMVYHYADYSDLPFLIKALDEHRHDNEGVLLAISKRDKRIEWCGSRAHSKILFQDMRMFQQQHKYFYIESGGHGIFPVIRPNLHDSGNQIYYSDYKLTNMHNQRYWKFIKECVEPEFAKHGVSMPWKWRVGNLPARHRKKSEGLI